jgi:hypothetical protein
MVLFKVTDVGLYKVLINDKDGVPVYSGYTWCKDEYFFQRKRRIRKDLKDRKMEMPDDGRMVFINMHQLIQDEKLPGIKETIMWTKPDFVLSNEAREISSRLYSLHDNIIKQIKKIATVVKTKLKKENEKVPFMKKLISSITQKANLLEVVFFNYEDKCTFKCFMYSKNDDTAFTFIKNDLKNRMIALKDIKEVLFKTYSGENFGVIWVTDFIKR